MRKLVVAIMVFFISVASAGAADPAQIVELGGYLPIATTAANTGGTGAGTAWVLLNHATTQIRQAANLQYFKMYFANVPSAISVFEMAIWRKNASGKYDRVHAQDFKSQITAPGIVTLTPSAPWVVLPGDLIGYRVTVTGTIANFLTYITNSNTVNGTLVTDIGCWWTASDPGTTNVDWPAKALPSTQIIPIKAFGSLRPQLISFGDSTSLGIPNNFPGADTVGTSYYAPNHLSVINPELSPAYQIADHFGITYQDMGRGGDGSVLLAARFAADVANYTPLIVVTNLGLINDNAWRWPTEQEQDAAFKTILDGIVNIGAIPVVVLGTPCAQTNPLSGEKTPDTTYAASMQAFDELQAKVKALCEASYPSAIIVEPQQAMGKEWTGQGAVPGNRWEFASADMTWDGVHLSALGAAELANAIIAAMEPAMRKHTLEDFNGDGKADVLWRNDDTGQVYMMLMDGGAITAQGQIYQESNTAWKIVAEGDFNGDGKADLLWRNATTGQVYMMLMNGGTITVQGQIYQESNTDWKIVDTADFNGDGKADILWCNDITGQVYMMLMDGGAITAQGQIYQESNTAWKIIGTGDFNGDGKADILWRNATTGQVYMMLMDGGTITAQGQIYQEPNTAWKIIGTADFNGDSKADILWRNDITGQVYMMLMDGFAITSQGQIYQEANTAWKIMATGDYNGDGKADILWRNDTTGQVYMMLMNGFAITAQGHIYQEANTAWKIVTVGACNPAGKSDLLRDYVTTETHQISDSAGETSAAFDITNVTLKRIGNNLQFTMTLSAPPQPASGCYKFLIDADSNRSTGDIRGDLGVDYFILVCHNNLTIDNRLTQDGITMKSHILSYVVNGNTLQITTDNFLSEHAVITWAAECFGDQGGWDSTAYKTWIVPRADFDMSVSVNPAQYMFDNGRAYLPLNGQLDLAVVASKGQLQLKSGTCTLLASSVSAAIAGSTVSFSGDYSGLTGPVYFNWYLQDCNLYVKDADFQLYFGDLFAGVHHNYVVPGINLYPSDFYDTDYYYPFTIDKMFADQDATHILDIIWEKEQDIAGVDPVALNGKKTLIYLDRDWSTGGYASGAQFDIAMSPKCIELEGRGYFRWDVLPHELGHHFTLNSKSFKKTLAPDSVYTESLASILYCWALEEIESEIDIYNLETFPKSVLLFESYTFSYVIQGQQTRHLNDLNSYQQAPDFSNMNVAIFFDMFVSISNNYGPQTTRNFFKIFSTANEQNAVFDTVTDSNKRHTFIIAALSAAVNHDLRTQFATWDFPIDNTYFETVYPTLRDMVE